MRFKLGLLSLAISGVLCTGFAQAEDLLGLYKEAYLRDPVVLQARATRDQAFASIDEATAALLPQLNLSAAVTASRTDPAHDVTFDNRAASAGVNLHQAVWRHSSWVNRTLAEKNAAKAEVLYSDALQMLILRVSQAYFNVLSARDSVSFAEANKKALKRQLDEATRRFHVGLIAETDQLEAQAAYDLASAEVISAKNALTNSYEDIRRLIGHAETDLHVLDEARFSPQPIYRSIGAIVQIAEENNLSLQASIIGRDMAKDAILLAQTGHEPTVDIVGNYGVTNNDYDPESLARRNGSTTNGSIALQLNMPIYSGGATVSRVEQAEQGYIIASEALEAAHRNMVAQANNNYNNIQAAISSVQAYQQTEKSAQSALDATQAGYDVGTRTISDVLDATQKLYNAKQALSYARFNYIMSRLRLLYTQGQLTVEDLEQINKGLKEE